MWRRNLYAAWAAQILSITGFGFALPFIPFYIQELGVTEPDRLRLWTGILSSGPALTMALVAPVWGMLADRLGRKIMMLRALLFGAIVLLLMSMARTAETVLVLRISQGLFTGSITAAGALVATGTPRDRLSYALGLLSSGHFIGLSLGPLVGGFAAEWLGYRASFAIGSGMLAAGFLLVWLLVRESDPAVATAPEAPTVKAAVGHGSPTTVGAAARAAPGGTAVAAADSAEPEKPLRRRQLAAFLTAPMLGLFAIIMILRFVRALPIPFLPLYIQELRGQLEGSASVTGLVSAGRGVVTALAAVTIVRLGDRHSRLNLVGLLLAAGGILSLPIFFARSLAPFAVLLIIATFFLGGVEPLVQADLSSRIPPQQRGLLFGIQTSISSLGWFAAPLVGTFVSITWDLPHVFLTLTVALFLTATIVMIVARRIQSPAPV